VPTPLEPLAGFLAEAFRRSASVADDPALAARCADHVTGNARLTPAEQVDIYRRQYWLRHLGSLAEDYPGLEVTLGKPAFEAFCRAYLEANPPTSYALRDLGHGIVAFADGYEHFPAGLEDLARDLVRFEHAFIDVFDGAEPPPLDPAKVQEMPEEAWSTARIVLHPLLRIMNFKYPVQEGGGGGGGGGGGADAAGGAPAPLSQGRDDPLAGGGPGRLCAARGDRRGAGARAGVRGGGERAGRGGRGGPGRPGPEVVFAVDELGDHR